MPPGFAVTSGWGPRTLRGKPSYHRGWDFGAPTGTPITASAPGVVTTAKNIGSCGKTVQVYYPMQGITATYCHLSEYNVTKGQKVVFGTVLGKVGNTGNSTGPHLHLTVWKGSTSVQPSGYFNSWR